MTQNVCASMRVKIVQTVTNYSTMGEVGAECAIDEQCVVYCRVDLYGVHPCAVSAADVVVHKASLPRIFTFIKQSNNRWYDVD